MKKKPVIGITLGDVAGIGPEVVEKALLSGKLSDQYLYRVIGHESAPQVLPGKISRPAAQFARESLEEGVREALTGEIAALVTAPVNKTGMKQAGFEFPGQTEFLAALTGTKKFAMMLVGGKLRVALVTTHVPVKDVSKLLRVEKIAGVIELTAHFCLSSGIRNPKIGVLGLNPHAGEIGDEEKKLIVPAIARARKILSSKPVRIAGPLSADTAFYYALSGRYDAMVCMYHDQGLIPLKMLAFDTGVNLTLGLPIIRTSPDHGTAYDIAGKDLAHPESMISAINMACELCSPARRKMK